MTFQEAVERGGRCLRPLVAHNDCLHPDGPVCGKPTVKSDKTDRYCLDCLRLVYLRPHKLVIEIPAE